MVSQVSVLWRRGLAPRSLAAFGFALACFGLATLLRLALGLVSPEVSPFATYYPAVLFAALIGGFAAGILVVNLSAVFACWAFMAPYFAFENLTSSQAVDILVYIGAAGLIAWAADGYGRKLHELSAEEYRRQLTLAELGHRARNKLATVSAILMRELKDLPEIRKKIGGRLHALAATDDFIANSEQQRASLSDILNMEFAPHGLSRAVLRGPELQLPPKIAAMLALMLHEMVTNAAKYGALSNNDGRVCISWSRFGSRVQISWLEMNGPHVVQPNRRGFGLSLLTNGLAEYDGKVETMFSSTGLSCKIFFSLPAGEDYSNVTVLPSDSRLAS